jgi:hypothetical protein
LLPDSLENVAVFELEVFHCHLVPVAGETHSSPRRPGYLVGDVVGIYVAVPVAQLVVSAQRRKSQDKLALLLLDLNLAVIGIRVCAHER